MLYSDLQVVTISKINMLAGHFPTEIRPPSPQFCSIHFTNQEISPRIRARSPTFAPDRRACSRDRPHPRPSDTRRLIPFQKGAPIAVLHVLFMPHRSLPSRPVIRTTSAVISSHRARMFARSPAFAPDRRARPHSRPSDTRRLIPFQKGAPIAVLHVLFTPRRSLPVRAQ